MQILHVIASMDPSSGGPCHGVRNLNTTLKKYNISREVVSLDDPGASFLNTDDFIIHTMGPAKSKWRYSSRLYPWLLQNLGRFDVVIVNGMWTYHIYAAVKAFQKLKDQINRHNGATHKIPKLFIMPHGMLDPYFQQAPGRRLKALRNWFYWKLIEHRNIARANGLLFTCELELQLARTSFTPYKPKQERNVSYGVEDLPSYKPEMKMAFLQKCPDLKNSPYLLYLSRIDPKKGVDILVKAYAKLFMLSKKNKSHKLAPKLVIAGPGMETAYGKKLKELVLRFPEMGKEIFFTGMLTGNSKLGAFYGCEAFVLPSHQENFGIAVVEALSCRKPVLITNQINIWKEIEESKGGLIEADTPDGIERLLKNWIEMENSDKELLTIAARSAYEKYFAIEPAAVKLLKVLEG